LLVHHFLEPTESKENSSWAKQGSVANIVDWPGWPKFAGNGFADQQARIEFKGSHFEWDVCAPSAGMCRL
jgi:hypothetical protein